MEYSLDYLKTLYSYPLGVLGCEAEKVKASTKKENIVTYHIDRNINYTNACSCACDFCYFYRDEKDSYLLSNKEIADKTEEAIKAGAIQILLQGGLHPTLKIDYYEKIIGYLRKRFPLLHIHAFSPPEILHISQVSNIGVEETLKRLIGVGLSSLPGGGAEILSNNARKRVSKNKCSASQWIFVMKEAMKLGIKASATMMFGFGETMEERLEHFNRIRNLQEEYGGFVAFIPWTYQAPKEATLKPSSSVTDYLKTLAISRILLTNIENIQVSWITQGLEIGTLSLAFGANDMGSVMLEENVVRMAGTHITAEEEYLRKAVENTGRVIKKRNFFYEIIE